MNEKFSTVTYRVFKIPTPAIYIEPSIRQWILKNRARLAATDEEIKEYTRRDPLATTVLLKDGKTREIVFFNQFKDFNYQELALDNCQNLKNIKEDLRNKLKDVRVLFVHTVLT